MRTITRLALALPLALAAMRTPLAAQESNDPPSLGAGAVAGQITLGLVGTGVGFVGGGLVTRSLASRLGADEERASTLAGYGAYAGIALLTPVGPMAIGSRGRATGSYLAGVGGAAVGMVGSYLLKKLGDSGALDCGACRIPRILAAAGLVLAPSVGATVGFNLSRERER
jgi:hypothetical protein